MADTWWRFYNTAPDHPKILRLTDAQFRAWTTLNSLHSKLGAPIPDEMQLIAMSLRKTVGKAHDLVNALLAANLLDRVEGGYVPHNWSEKQFKSDVSTERVQRFRERQRNVSETSHRQRHSTETEKKEVTPSAFPDWWPDEAWSGFVAMRGKIRAPLTPRAIVLLVTKLTDLRANGNDPAAVLDRSTENSWRGVFPLPQAKQQEPDWKPLRVV